MRRLLLATALAALAAAPALAAPSRIVSLGGAVTEIVVALGAQEQLVARDSTSTFPPSVATLPDVGYVRALSPEGVLALGPELILAEATAGPPEAIEVLRAAGVDFRTLPGAASPEGVLEKIAAVGAALDREAEAATLAADFTARMQAAEAKAAATGTRKRALFVLGTQGGRVIVGGAGSSAAAILALAGAENAATGFSGYKQMTDEALLAAAPEVIVMMDRAGEGAMSGTEVLAHPALGATPAGKAGAVIRMDGMLLLGFGPRTPEAVEALHAALYPEAG